MDLSQSGYQHDPSHTATGSLAYYLLCSGLSLSCLSRLDSVCLVEHQAVRSVRGRHHLRRYRDHQVLQVLQTNPRYDKICCVPATLELPLMLSSISGPQVGLRVQEALGRGSSTQQAQTPSSAGSWARTCPSLCPAV